MNQHKSTCHMQIFHTPIENGFLSYTTYNLPTVYNFGSSASVFSFLLVCQRRCWRPLPPRAKPPPLRRWRGTAAMQSSTFFPTVFGKRKPVVLEKYGEKIAFSKLVSFSVSHEFLVWRFFSMKFFHFAEPFFASPLLTYCHTIVTFVTFVDLMFSNQIFYPICPEIQFRRGVSVNGCTRSWAVSSPRKTLPLPWSVLSCWKSNLTNLTLWKLVKLVNVEQYWRHVRELVSYDANVYTYISRSFHPTSIPLKDMFICCIALILYGR